MLFDLLAQTCEDIEQLDAQREAPLMLKEIKRARPEFVERLRGSNITDDVFAVLTLAVATGVIVHIKEIPSIVNVMVDAINNRRTDPAIRCAVVGVLAYLVQPHDLIPDNAPGGYGYVDDNALLRAGLIEYLNLLPPKATDAEKQREYLSSAGSIVPLSVLPALEASIVGMTSAFHILRALPPQLIEMTTQQVITNPLQATTPTPQPGFAQPTPPSLNDGHWSGGAYFEGGNVVMPGGPSLIDGQLFIPDY